jgi:hypothetical protein
LRNKFSRKKYEATGVSIMWGKLLPRIQLCSGQSLENSGKKEVNREERMYRRSALVLAVAALFTLGASQVQAKTKTINGSATITGTVTIGAGGGDDGACHSGVYDDQCFAAFGGPDVCTCANDETGHITGSFGKGDVQIDVTVDTSEEVADNAGHGCEPIFGELDVTITDKKKAGNAEVDINGTVCHHLTKDGPDIIEGGFAINDCFEGSGENAGTSAGGYGEVDGTVDRATGKLVLKLHGPITISSTLDQCL